MIYKNNISKSSQSQKYTSTPPEPTTVVPTNVPTNRRDPQLEGGHYTKIFGMWTLKNDISSPKLYELLIKIELKWDTDLYLKNFFNHIKMCLNAVTIIREDLLLDHPSYSCNAQTYTSFGHSLLVSLVNATNSECPKEV